MAYPPDNYKSRRMRKAAQVPGAAAFLRPDRRARGGGIAHADGGSTDDNRGSMAQAFQDNNRENQEKMKAAIGKPEFDKVARKAMQDIDAYAQYQGVNLNDSDASWNQPTGKKNGGGIHIKKSHQGLLHKNLGIAAGKKIPTKKLEAAKASAGPAEKKRIVFAENAKKFKHGGK